jgi:hypothetical protein
MELVVRATFVGSHLDAVVDNWSEDLRMKYCS